MAEYFGGIGSVDYRARTSVALMRMIGAEFGF